MPDNTQTTRYLYQFAVQDDATQKFREYINRLKQYEQEMATTMKDMDKIMGNVGGMPGGTQSLGVTFRDGKLAVNDYRREVEGLNQGLFTSKEQLNRFGDVVGSVSTLTYTSADGIRMMYRDINTDATPGKAQLRGFTKEVEDGTLKSRTFLKHLNDQADTVQRIKVLYNQAGNEVQRLVTTTATVGETRSTTQEVINTASNIPQVTAYTEHIQDGVARSKEWTESLNDQAGTVERVKILYNQAGHELERLTTTMSTVNGVTTTTFEGVSTPEVASGIPQLTAYNEAMKNGSVASKEWTANLNDQYKTVVYGKETYDAAGKTLTRMGRATYDLGDGVERTKVKMEGFNKKIDEGTVLGSRFVRHMIWIGQGLLLWGGINAVTNALREWWQVQTDLNTALAEFEMRTNATPEQLDNFQQSIIETSRNTALPISTIAPIAPYAPDTQTLDYAAQLNRVAGGNLQNQLQWLVAQQRQFNIEAEDTTVILNAMYGAWQQTTLPMDQFVTMLRDAAPLAQEFNLSMEDMYALFGAMQSVTGAEGRELDYLSRNLARLYSPGVPEKLGIQTTAVQPDLTIQRKDMITILTELNQKIQDGEISYEQAGAAMGATGRRQLQLFKSLMLGWNDFIAAIDASKGSSADWRDAFGTSMERAVVSIDNVKSAWDALMASFGQTGLVTGVIQRLTYELDQMRKVLDGTISFKDVIPMGYNYRQLMAAEAAQKAYGTDETRFLRTGAARTATSTAEPYTSGPAPLGSFPSMYNIPEGVSFGQIQSSMDQWTRAFEALGPQFQAWINENQESVLVYDENTKTLQQMTGFLPALQRAISENTQQLKQQDLNVGLRTVDTNLNETGPMLQQWIRYYTDYLNRLGMPQESRPQLIVGEDNTFLRLWASNEALMLALRELTEATEDQTDVLSGMWNVPEGATMWVPIQSLFYSRQKESQAGGPADFLAGPPSTLPSQQAKWESLSGAVEQMTVSNMSVLNMEGLTIPITENAPTSGTTMGLNLADRIMEYASKMSQLAQSSQQAALIAALQTAFGNRVPVITKETPKKKWENLPWQMWENGPAQDPSNTGAYRKITVASTEIQTPVTEITTPTSREMVSTAYLTAGAGTTVTAPLVSLIAGGMTGLPSFDTTALETILTGMASTLLLINTNILNQRPVVITPTPSYPGPGGPQEAMSDLGAYIDNHNYLAFQVESRMKESF